MSAIALVLVCSLFASADEPGIPAPAPSATVSIGPVGNPPAKDYVRLDGNWANCGTATSAKIQLYKGTVANKANAVYIGELSASPAGASGKLGGDMTDPTKFKSGDNVFATIKVFNGALVVAENITKDYKSP